MFNVCPYCYHLKEDYLNTGKLGCPFCYGRLLSWNQASFYSQKSKDFLVNFLDHSSSLVDAISFFQSKNISIRLRFARNLKGYPFKLTSYDKKSFYNILNQNLKDYFVFNENQTIYQSKILNINLFDEDHLRLYTFPDSIQDLQIFLNIIAQIDKKEIFVKDKNYGFLTACPTNLGFANKLSLKITAHSNLNKKVYNKAWMVYPKQTIVLEKDSLVFFLKNFNYFEAKKFLKTWFQLLKDL